MALDLLKRAEKGSALSANEHDTNFTNIETEVNAKIGSGGVTFEALDANGDVGTGADQVAAGDHTHAQLHDRSHAVTSTSDHTATAHRLFYSNGSGQVAELAFGTSGQRLQSNGASSAPSFTDPAVGVQSPELDSGDYSSTPKTMADEWGVHRIFTNANDHIIQFPAGLTVGANGFLYAPPANTVSMRRVTGSGVSIDGVASDGALPDAFTIPAGTRRFWMVVDTNTILTDIGSGGGTAGDVTVPGAATFEDDVTLQGASTGAGLVNVTRGAGSSQPTTADSNKLIETDGAITIPNSAIGSGWFQCTLEIGADTHDITFNSLTLDISAAGFTAGELYAVIAKSASAIRIQGPAGTFTESDMS